MVKIDSDQGSSRRSIQQKLAETLPPKRVALSRPRQRSPEKPSGSHILTRSRSKTAQPNVVQSPSELEGSDTARNTDRIRKKLRTRKEKKREESEETGLEGDLSDLSPSETESEVAEYTDSRDRTEESSNRKDVDNEEELSDEIDNTGPESNHKDKGKGRAALSQNDDTSGVATKPGASQDIDVDPSSSSSSSSSESESDDSTTRNKDKEKLVKMSQKEMKDLPQPWEKDAPRFTGKAEDLPKYLKHIAYCFEQYGIDDEHKKEVML